jgi:hypothetical protein
MPFTPFHFGPAILLSLLLLKYIDFPTFVAANIVVDWRATLVFFDILEGPLHSWPSTYPGALVSGLLLGVTMLYVRPYLDKDLREMKIIQEISKGKIFLAAISGVILHVTIDAFHHPNIHPFLIEGFKPLFGLFSTYEVRLFCLGCLFLSWPVYLLHLKTEYEEESAEP